MAKSKMIKTRVTKAEVKRVKHFVATFHASLTGLGAQLDSVDEDPDYPGVEFPTFKLSTLAGTLQVTVYDNWLACRFSNVESAKKLLSHRDVDRLNKFSGKWNFNFADISEPLSCWNTFKWEYELIAPTEEADLKLVEAALADYDKSGTVQPFHLMALIRTSLTMYIQLGELRNKLADVTDRLETVERRLEPRDPMEQ